MDGPVDEPEDKAAELRGEPALPPSRRLGGTAECRDAVLCGPTMGAKEVSSTGDLGRVERFCGTVKCQYGDNELNNMTDRDLQT